MLLRPWNTRLCALKLTLHHAVGEGHDIAFARCRKRDDRPSDLLSAFVFIGGEPEYKGGGGECLIHNFDLFGTESCPLQETDYFHEVVPELPGAHMGSIQPPQPDFWRMYRGERCFPARRNPPCGSCLYHLGCEGFGRQDPDELGSLLEYLRLVERRLPLAYYWWADRRGFVNKTLNAWECDVIIGVPTHDDLVRTTRPYYCSRYVMVHRQGQGGAPALLGEPQVRSLRIGVVERTPPLGMLLQRNLDLRIAQSPLSAPCLKSSGARYVDRACWTRQKAEQISH
jgi:hypothetical protein